MFCGFPFVTYLAFKFLYRRYRGGQRDRAREAYDSSALATIRRRTPGESKETEDKYKTPPRKSKYDRLQDTCSDTQELSPAECAHIIGKHEDEIVMVKDGVADKRGKKKTSFFGGRLYLRV